ncbi:MAG: NADH-quinone oxidoreductase subunit K [Firmicutes bacterium]|nr:NADH-quinone oxidoreductase subunit K [Bacillota bacterium]
MNVLSIAILTAALLLIVTGLYMLVRTYNMIRIIIAVEVAMKAITLLLAYAGWLNGQTALSQAFVVTIIVMEVVVAVVAAGLAISSFRKNGDVDIRRLNKLNG